MQTNQTVLSLQGCNLPNDPVTTQKKHQGRTPDFLTAQDIQECLKYFSASNPEREQVMMKFGKKKIMHSLAICRLDMGRQGKIFRTICQEHGRTALTYGWHNIEGVRVKYIAPNCHLLNTHFMSEMFHTDVMMGIESGDS